VNTMMRKAILTLTLLTAVSSSACGLKGDLYIEEEVTAESVPADPAAAE